jgi:hypothetical protein
MAMRRVMRDLFGHLSDPLPFEPSAPLGTGMVRKWEEMKSEGHAQAPGSLDDSGLRSLRFSEAC